MNTLNFTNIDQVTCTINLLDTGVIEDAIQKIKNAKRVSIFARGFRKSLALKCKLNFNYLVNTVNFIPIQTSSKRSVRAFFQVMSRSKELITAAKNCYQAEIGMILITATKESSLVSLRGYKSESSLFPDYEVRSRLPLLAIARILLDAYVIRTK